ncbi:O-antigen translocase [Aestuariivivens sp. NBU2969]|uniref:O-antigen translocase n=1 Tax=Aestuariivivens sp. NBU2969 TaxID=2873267 RepID=UPI001CBF8EF8|nr:O-antigen translocase [Aestuariivivens sp. NBU2969]
MKRLLAYINSKVLVKIASLKMVSVFVKMLSGILTSKAIALFIGAEGLALIGNLRNFTSSIQSVSTVGVYNGAVKYIADFREDVVRLGKTISTVFYLGFVVTILLSFLCYFFAESINDLIFPDYNNYAYVIKIFAIVLPFYALNMFSFSIMNGFAKYKNLIVINIIGQTLGLSVALILIYQKRIDGALISVAIAEALIFLITLVGIINRKSLSNLIQVKEISFWVIKKLSPYSMMALFSAIILPLVLIAIRSYIIEYVSYKDAGFWEAMTRISKYYLMFVTALMAFYILPRFAEIDTVKEFRKEVFNFYKAVVPMFALGLILIYLLRSVIVTVVFSEEFEPVEELFLWQLLGDFVKVLSTVIAYQFLAKKMFWHYIVTEAFLVIILYVTSIYFIKLFGVEGAVIGHLVSYTMYFGLILLIFGSSLFGVDNQRVE